MIREYENKNRCESDVCKVRVNHHVVCASHHSPSNVEDSDWCVGNTQLLVPSGTLARE